MGETLGDALYRQLGRASSQFQKSRALSTDILENEVAYYVVFDAPGVNSEDIQVRFLNGRVRIRLDRFRPYREGFEMRYPGRSMSLEGEASLPDDAVVEPTAATARLTDTGTLAVEIPKEPDGEERETADVELDLEEPSRASDGGGDVDAVGGVDEGDTIDGADGVDADGVAVE